MSNPDDRQPLPSDPAAIEALIAERREHLAATVDELAVRAHPRSIALRTKNDLQSRVRDATMTPEGDVRIERIGAVAGALVAVAALFAWNRRRLRRKGKR